MGGVEMSGIQSTLSITVLFSYLNSVRPPVGDVKAVRIPILACSVGSFFSSGYKENVAPFFIKSPSATGPASEYLYL